MTAREYVPYAAWVLSWAALTAGLGLTAAIWLMAANGFVQATRSLFLMQSFDAISARQDCAVEVKAQARRAAFRVDVAVLLGCLALLLPMALGLRAIGLSELGTMMAIMALGLPARTPALLALDRCNIGTGWRVGSACAMVAGAGIVLLFGLHWAWAALVLALREWGGLMGAWLGNGIRPTRASGLPTGLGFAEIASRTSIAARRRLVYRIGKIGLSALGPLGSIIARTGRGGGLDGRLARKLPANPVAIALLGVACLAAAIAIVVASREPPALLLASVVARVAGAALSALIWWRWGEAKQFPDWLNEEL